MFPRSFLILYTQNTSQMYGVVWCKHEFSFEFDVNLTVHRR